MIELHRRLNRNRRRLALCVPLLFMAGTLVFLGQGQAVLGIPMEVLGGVVFTAIFLPLALLTCLLFPHMRFQCEIASTTLLFMALAERLLPGGLLSAENTIFLLLFLVIGANAIGRLYLSPDLDAMLPSSRVTSRATALSAVTTSDVMDGLLAAEPAQGDAQRRIKSSERALSVEEIHTLETSNAPSRLAVSWRIQGGDPLQSSHDKRRIDVATTIERMPLREAILGWLDDTTGRILDDHLSFIEARAQTA
ncbi:MAG: hypothetical protein AAFY03_01005 [Pseudomonadota bacterium]